MKNKMFTVSIIILGMTMCVLPSCKKEKIRGCKDVYATNYKSTAEEDDGSCQFSSKVIFWQDNANASSWSSLGVTALKFYVDGSLIGSSAATVYNSTPSCSSSGLASTTKNLGSSKTKSVSYSVKDQNNFEWYSGTLNLDGTTCTTQKLN